MRAWQRDGYEAAREALLPYLPLINFEQQAKIALAVRKECLRQRGLIADAGVRAPAAPFPEVLRTAAHAPGRGRRALAEPGRRADHGGEELMDLGITGKTALVAASTGGLGLAIARALAAEGVRVAITGRRGDRAKEIAAELHGRLGPGAVAIEADLSTAGRRGRRRRTAVADSGPSTSWCSTARARSPARPPRSAPTTSPRRSTSWSNRTTPWSRASCRACGNGAGAGSWPSAPAASRHRCRTWPCPTPAAPRWPATSRPSPPRWPLDGVTVNMLLPGRIATDRVAELDQAAAKRRGTTPEDIQLESRKTIPARRYGEPEEFGAAAAFLCSAPASYITGVALRCDGGLDPQALATGLTLSTHPAPTLRRNTMTSTTQTPRPHDRDLITAQHLINGEWLGAADTERMNPARPGELAALSPSGTAADVDAAITAAAAAQPAWAALPAPARGAILMAAGNLLLDARPPSPRTWSARRARPWPRPRAR